MEDAKNPQKLEEEYARVLTNYALNRNLAYRYVQSGAGARGMLQIMPKVFQGLSDLYPDVDIGDDLTECAMDPTKSIITNTLKLDDDLRALQMSTDAFSDDDYMAFRNGKENLYFPLALGITYNYGYQALKRMQSLQALTTIALPEETRIYLEKLKYVWEKLTRQKLGGGNILGHDRKPREYKKNPEKIFNQSEAGMRTVLKGSRKRLVFEKHRATQVAKRALDYQDTRDQLKAGRLVRVTSSSNYMVDRTIGNE